MIKFVVKPGFFEKRRSGTNQPGLDLWRVTLDTLVDRTLAVTNDCCNYYPTFPIIEVVDVADPTESEMANVPVGGFFRTVVYNGSVYYYWLYTKTGAGSYKLISTNG